MALPVIRCSPRGRIGEQRINFPDLLSVMVALTSLKGVSPTPGCPGYTRSVYFGSHRILLFASLTKTPVR